MIRPSIGLITGSKTVSKNTDVWMKQNFTYLEAGEHRHSIEKQIFGLKGNIEELSNLVNVVVW